jgi:DNA-binding NarL/FixJ family response regulator
MAAVEDVLSCNGVSVVGRATLADEALQLIREHEPDLLIAEVATREALSCLSGALELRPDLKVIVLSTSRDPDDVDAALAAGAAAYVVKTAQPEDLVSAVRQAFKTSVYLAGDRSFSSARRPEPNGDVKSLTQREVEILRLVADGRSNAQVARVLWVTEQTVKFHLSNIYRKLSVANRTEASRWAQLHGLLPAAEPRSAA